MENLERNLKMHVIELSENIGERNFVYYEALNKACNFIIQEFKKYGYEPEIQSYNFEGKTYRNIIAVKNGSLRPQEIVVVGAHYDSIIGSPGANDNASGVSTLLELSRLVFRIDTDRTIKFIAFVNEEPPFFLSGNMGSRIYARDAKERKEDIKAMISLETIGYYSEKPDSQSYPLWYGLLYPKTANFIGVISNFGSRRLIRKIEEVFKRNSKINIIAVAAPGFVSGVTFSDHDSFWRYGYQACMVTDTAFYRYPYYHTEEDTYEKIDYANLSEVTKGLYHSVIELAACRNPGRNSNNSAFIVPIGDIDKTFLEKLASILGERFSIVFKIGGGLDIPRDAFNSKRSQYNSSKILDRLKHYNGEKILGIIGKDLYVEELNFVFGQAESPGRAALISITRLNQEFYGLPKDDKIFFERAIKEAVHELGHTYGLTHCYDSSCVMFFSNSLQDTDRKESFFCSNCQRIIEAHI